MYCEVLGQLSTSVTGSCQYPGSNARRWRCSQLVGNVHPCTAELIIICMRPSYLVQFLFSAAHVPQLHSLTVPDGISIVFFYIVLLTNLWAFINIYLILIFLSIMIRVLLQAAAPNFKCRFVSTRSTYREDSHYLYILKGNLSLSPM